MITVAYSTLSLIDAARKLKSDASDILILDTCITLDIVRLPNGDRVPNATQLGATIRAVEQVIAKQKEGALSIILPCRIVDEWTRNSENIRAETEREATKLESTYRKFSVVSRRISGTLPELIFPCRDLAQNLYELSRDVLYSGIHLERDQLSSDKALTRCFDEIPPSRKGAAPDSVIYEQALNLVDQLAESSSQRKIAFATSNTRDFCQNNRPKPPIDSELSSRGIAFCSNWSAIVRELEIYE